MKRFRWGMIGGGKGAFIGGAHRIAAKIANSYDLVGGVFDVDYERAKEFARDENIDLRRVYPDIDSFILGESGLPVSENAKCLISHFRFPTILALMLMKIAFVSPTSSSWYRRLR